MRLDSLRLIRVAGVDRTQFLQGQVTQDIHETTAARSALFGWTNAQGRLLLVGQMFAWQDALWLSAPAATAASLTRRLRQFVLRSRVTVDISDLAVLGMASPNPTCPLELGSGHLAADPLACTATAHWVAMRVAGDPARVLIAAEPATVDGLVTMLGAETASQPEWNRADIGAGLPSISAEVTEAFVPQMVNLDLLGGVSFTKGCYSGQEIITRTRHLGRIKRRMFRFRCEGTIALDSGAVVFGADREAGRVIATAATPAGLEILAVTQLDEMQGPLFADISRSRRLTRLGLPYAIPEAGMSSDP